MRTVWPGLKDVVSSGGWWVDWDGAGKNNLRTGASEAVPWLSVDRRLTALAGSEQLECLRIQRQVTEAFDQHNGVTEAERQGNQRRIDAG